MDDNRHVTSIVRGELSKAMDQGVLFEEAIAIGVVHAHHELKIVDDHMPDVVNGHSMTHRLEQTSRSVTLPDELHLR